jgi:hypothetical protein
MLLPSKNKSEGSGTDFLFYYGIFRIFQKWQCQNQYNINNGSLHKEIGIETSQINEFCIFRSLKNDLTK